MTTTTDAQVLTRPAAVWSLMSALTAGALIAVTAVAIGLAAMTAIGLALVFLALAGGVLSNWSP